MYVHLIDPAADSPAYDDQLAEALARRAPDGGAPVSGRSSGGSRPARVKDTDTQALESDLSSVLGLDVEIDHRGGAGALMIRYATLEQLDDLCNRLTRGA